MNRKVNWKYFDTINKVLDGNIHSFDSIDKRRCEIVSDKYNCPSKEFLHFYYSIIGRKENETETKTFLKAINND